MESSVEMCFAVNLNVASEHVTSLSFVSAWKASSSDATVSHVESIFDNEKGEKKKKFSISPLYDHRHIIQLKTSWMIKCKLTSIAFCRFTVAVLFSADISLVIELMSSKLLLTSACLLELLFFSAKSSAFWYDLSASVDLFNFS